MSDLASQVEQAMQTSMMQRVPAIAVDLIRAGMEEREAIKQAILLAKEQEEKNALMVVAPSNYYEQEISDAIRSYMCDRVYYQLRGTGQAPSINPRWVACQAALGKEIRMSSREIGSPATTVLKRKNRLSRSHCDTIKV